MPAVVVNFNEFTYYFNVERDASVANGRLTLQVQGYQTTGGGFIQIPFGSTYAQIMDLIRAQTALYVQQQFGVELGPDDTIQIFGGPQPTLADLGG